jgi:MbtH protein
MEEREDNTIYKVVVNHEEQFSIGPADRDNPPGWKNIEKAGPKRIAWPLSKKWDRYEAA